MSKNLDIIVCHQPEKRCERKETTIYSRGRESPVSLPGRNEYPGIHCSLILQKKKRKKATARSAREFEVKERTKRESERSREMVDLLVLS